MVCRDGVLLATEKGSATWVKEYDARKIVPPVEKFSMIGEHAAIGYSGLLIDSQIVTDEIKNGAFDTTDELLQGIRKIFWIHVTRKDVRPLGICLLVASCFDSPKLHLIDASGSTIEVYAWAIGRKSEDAQKVLAERYELVSMDDAEDAAIAALGNPPEYTLARVA